MGTYELYAGETLRWNSTPPHPGLLKPAPAGCATQLVCKLYLTSRKNKKCQYQTLHLSEIVQCKRLIIRILSTHPFKQFCNKPLHKCSNVNSPHRKYKNVNCHNNISCCSKFISSRVLQNNSPLCTITGQKPSRDTNIISQPHNMVKNSGRSQTSWL